MSLFEKNKILEERIDEQVAEFEKRDRLKKRMKCKDKDFQGQYEEGKSRGCSERVEG